MTPFMGATERTKSSAETAMTICTATQATISWWGTKATIFWRAGKTWTSFATVLGQTNSTSTCWIFIPTVTRPTSAQRTTGWRQKPALDLTKAMPFTSVDCSLDADQVQGPRIRWSDRFSFVASLVLNDQIVSRLLQIDLEHNVVFRRLAAGVGVAD